MAESASDALRAFSSNADAASASVERLSSSTSSFNRILENLISLPGVREMNRFNESSSDLARTMGLSGNAVRGLVRDIEALSTQTSRYSTRELQDMVIGMSHARSEIAASTSETIKLAEALSQRLGKGAGDAAQLIVRMRDAMPELDVAIERGTIGLKEYHLAYMKFGREGAAALMYAREGMKGLDADTADALRGYSKNVQEANKKVEDAFLKVGKAAKKIWSGVSPDAIGAAKGISEVVAQVALLHYGFTNLVKPLAGWGLKKFGFDAASPAHKAGGFGAGIPIPLPVRIVGTVPGGTLPGAFGGTGGGKAPLSSQSPANAANIQQRYQAALGGAAAQSAPSRLRRFGQGALRAARSPGAMMLAGGLAGAAGLALEAYGSGDNSRLGRTATAASPILEYGGLGLMTGNPLLALLGVTAGATKSIYNSLTGSADNAAHEQMMRQTPEKLMRKVEDQTRITMNQISKRAGGKDSSEYLSELSKATKAAQQKAEADANNKELSANDKQFSEHTANRMAIELEKARSARETRIEAEYRPAAARAEVAAFGMSRIAQRGGIASADTIRETKKAYDEQLQAAEKLVRQKKETVDLENKVGTASADSVLQYKEALDLVEQIKQKTISLREEEVKRAQQAADIYAQQTKQIMMRHGYITGTLGIEGEIAQKERERGQIAKDLSARDEELVLLKERISELSDKDKGKAIEKFNNETETMRMRDRQLEEQISINKQYDKESVLIGHRLSLLKSDIELRKLMKDPMAAAASAQQVINQNIQQANLAIGKMQAIAKVSGTNTEEYRKAQREAKDAIVAAAQSADYVRRTFAEEFSAMAMGMPSGSYLMNYAPSGYAQFGPAALTSPEGGVRYSRSGGFQTREQSIMGMFGNRGRSGFDEFLGALSAAADGQYAASKMSKEVANALYRLAVANGAVVGSSP